jgi:hypothetical protein
LRNGNVDLSLENKSLCLSLRPPGDGNRIGYGRSQLENVRSLWGQWKHGAQVDNVDRRLYDAYLGAVGSARSAIHIAVDVLDACADALNGITEKLLGYNFGPDAIATAKVAFRMSSDERILGLPAKGDSKGKYDRDPFHGVENGSLAAVGGAEGQAIAKVEQLQDTTGWLTVSQAAKSSNINKGEISRACDCGAIHSVGKKRARRLDPSNFKVWKQNRQRRGEVTAAFGMTQTSPPKAKISSGMCRQCGETVTLREGRGQCPKCKNESIDPMPPRGRNVAQRRKLAK